MNTLKTVTLSVIVLVAGFITGYQYALKPLHDEDVRDAAVLDKNGLNSGIEQDFSATVNTCWSNTAYLNSSLQYLVPRRVLMDALTRSADNGNAFSLTELGWLLDQGHTVPQNLKLAYNFYVTASTKGSARATGKLGLMYAEGRGVEVDYEEALDLMLMAANQGDYEAQNNLGIMYGNGFGVEKDEEKAFHWFQKSALQGSEVGQFNLGRSYAGGKGVEKDINKAVELYEKASRGGDVDAHNNLGVIYSTGPEEYRDMSAAVYYFAIAASLGNHLGQLNLGRMYFHGQGGLAVDEVMARSLIEMSANQGNEEAIEILEKLPDLGISDNPFK